MIIKIILTFTKLTTVASQILSQEHMVNIYIQLGSKTQEGLNNLA